MDSDYGNGHGFVSVKISNGNVGVSVRVRLGGGIMLRTVVMIVSVMGWDGVRVVHPGHVSVTMRVVVVVISEFY